MAEKEIQNTTQQVDDSKVFYINTIGSCSRAYVEILYPKKMGFNELLGLSYKSRTLETDIAVFEIEMHDSAKNWHRSIKIVPKVPMIVRQWGQGSCNHNSIYDNVWLLQPQKEPEEVEIKNEIKEVDEDKYHKKIVINFVEFNGENIEISKEVIEATPIISSLELTITVTKDKVIISGDTFNVRDVIKSLKFKWNGVKKVWERNGSDYDDIQLALEQKGVKVNVKDETLSQ